MGDGRPLPAIALVFQGEGHHLRGRGEKVLTYNDLWQFEFKKLVTAELERLASIVASPKGPKDHSEYKQYVGQIQGLRRAIELSEEAQTIAQNKT